MPGAAGSPNIPVTFMVTAGEGSTEPATNRTNGAGIATASWRVGTIAGSQQQVVATVLDTLTGALVDTAIFVATRHGGAAGESSFRSAGNGVGDRERARRRLYHCAPSSVTLMGTSLAGQRSTGLLVEGQATLAAATSLTNALGEATNTVTPAPIHG